MQSLNLSTRRASLLKRRKKTRSQQLQPRRRKSVLSNQVV